MKHQHSKMSRQSCYPKDDTIRSGSCGRKEKTTMQNNKEAKTEQLNLNKIYSSI
jgi:hypothetical protein